MNITLLSLFLQCQHQLLTLSTLSKMITFNNYLFSAFQITTKKQMKQADHCKAFDTMYITSFFSCHIHLVMSLMEKLTQTKATCSTFTSLETRENENGFAKKIYLPIKAIFKSMLCLDKFLYICLLLRSNKCYHVSEHGWG